MAAKEWSHLFTVENTIHLERAKLLVLSPHFSIPKDFPDKHVEIVRVDTPSGLSFEASAQFHFSHFNIQGPVDPDLLWRLTVALVNVSPEQVPIGSNIFTSPELVARIQNRKPNGPQ